MEKIELKVTMESERLDALRYFLSVKEKSTPEKELQRALDQLYEKCVAGVSGQQVQPVRFPPQTPAECQGKSGIASSADGACTEYDKYGGHER